MAAAAFWAVVASAGCVMMIAIASRPGAAVARGDWPADSKLARTAGTPTLVVFMHPRCPCSEATLSELARGIQDSDGIARIYTVFAVPPGADADWTASDLVVAAGQVPGVRVVIDAGGEEAARFGAITSGQVLLFDAENRCVLNGGITPSRGHEGDTAGRDLIEAVLAGHEVSKQILKTPVFGCGLYLAHAAKRTAL